MDRFQIAKEYIQKGYKTVTVLKYAGLSRSTYYYHISIEGKVKSMSENVGRPIVGYSLTNSNKKVCDEEIKEYIIEAIQADAFYYGYHKITYYLRRKYNLIINHKKVYRLCKELQILKKQRIIKPEIKSTISINRIIKKSNELWEADIKYGYIAGENKFFFVLSVIDVFDRAIVDYHLGLSATAKDASRVLETALKKRGFKPGDKLPVIRTDNGPQFIAKDFEKTCNKWEIYHERIPVKSPNLNAYIESFHSILEDECYSRYLFKSFAHVYEVITDYMDYYNNRRRHGSIKNMAPNKFYKLWLSKDTKTSLEIVA